MHRHIAAIFNDLLRTSIEIYVIMYKQQSKLIYVVNDNSIEC